MLATLAIINMAVASALIVETADDRSVQEPVAVVTTVDTPEYVSWAEE